MKIQKAIFGTVVAFGIGVTSSASAQSYTITDLGPGSAIAVNDLGTVVLYAGYLWNNGTFVSLSPDFHPKDINNSGVVVGTMGTSGGDRAYTWSNGSFTALPSLPMQGANDLRYSTAVSINDNGQTVGSMVMPAYVGGGVWRATVWQSTAISSDLHWKTLAGDYPSAQWANSDGYAINDLGQVVGTSQSSSGYLWRPFIYTNGQLAELSANNGFDFAGARPSDINNLGTVVGDSQNDSGFILKADGTITVLGGFMRVRSLNDSNFVVGSVAGHAFLYDGTNTINLSELTEVRTAGWESLDYANDINNAGQIVGYGTLNGAQHAFLLTPSNPIPEPETYAMMLGGLGLLGVVAYRRRQKTVA